MQIQVSNDIFIKTKKELVKVLVSNLINYYFRGILYFTSRNLIYFGKKFEKFWRHAILRLK